MTWASATLSSRGIIRKVADVGAVTGPGTGTASYTWADAPTLYDQTNARNFRDSVALAANDVRTALRNAGVMA